MNKPQFLAQADISHFITWLIERLPNIPIQLNIRASRFNPVAINLNVQGLPSVLQHYAWNSTWTDETNQIVDSCDWESTRLSLNRLATYLRSAIEGQNDQVTLAACLQTLKWGGVRGAVGFLKQQARANTLSEYLRACQPFFDLNRNQDLAEINAVLIQRFDAGMTKIHSLLDRSGSPIYDSRVGAAMAVLYQLYHRENGGESVLNFPTGAARGSQIRDPGALGFRGAPQFYTRAVPPHEWAQYQVKLGWIVEALAHQNWFDGDVHDQCRAMEACLFMVGYDLRALVPENPEVPLLKTKPKSICGEMTMKSSVVKSLKKSAWVPSGHPFIKVLNYFLAFRNANPGGDRGDFIAWLVNEIGLKQSTAKSYCFPLNENEFDLWDRPVVELEMIVRGGKDALSCAIQDREVEIDERGWVCLTDARIVGVLREHDLNSADMVSHVIKHKFAGTINAAKTLISVGNQVGNHFGLLDIDGKATPLFYEVFGRGGLDAILSSY